LRKKTCFTAREKDFLDTVRIMLKKEFPFVQGTLIILGAISVHEEHGTVLTMKSTSGSQYDNDSPALTVKYGLI
jgi:hypothetical protein